MILSKYSLRYKGKRRVSFRRFLFLRCDACGKTFLSSYNITAKLRQDYHFCCLGCSKDGMKKGNVLYLKAQKKSLERYGTEHPIQSVEIKKRNLERFGTEYPCQSDEIRAKISKSSLGKKMSLEARQKMAERKREVTGKDHPLFGTVRLDMRGPNNINWKGGISSLYKKIRRTSQYFMWRSTCFERDKWTCVECGKTNCELHVDHIIPFAIIIAKSGIKEVWEAFDVEDLWDTTNGRTLCIECHKKTDTYGGNTKTLLSEIRNEV